MNYRGFFIILPGYYYSLVNKLINKYNKPIFTIKKIKSMITA